MDNSKHNPGKVVVGNANLPIGAVDNAKIGAVDALPTGFSGEKNANRPFISPTAFRKRSFCNWKPN